MVKSIFVKLHDGQSKMHSIEGSFRHCQAVLYAMYGRLNIARIQFCVNERWIDSPYLVNRLEVYDEQP